MVLCRKGPSGRPRIEMYRSEDSVGGQQPVRMIDLETVRSVQPVGEPEKATVCIRWTCSSWCECTQCVYPHVCNTDSSSAHCAISHHMIWQHLLYSRVSYKVFLTTLHHLLPHLLHLFTPYNLVTPLIYTTPSLDREEEKLPDRAARRDDDAPMYVQG